MNYGFINDLNMIFTTDLNYLLENSISKINKVIYYERNRHKVN